LIQVIGDFTETSLDFNTITIDGGEGDDTIDISSLQSAHRIVFRSNGGNDMIVGALRPQDVIQLPEGMTQEGSTLTTTNGLTTISGAEHSVSFVSDGMPIIRLASGEEFVSAPPQDNEGPDDDDVEEVEDETETEDDQDDTQGPGAGGNDGGSQSAVRTLNGTSGDDIITG